MLELLRKQQAVSNANRLAFTCLMILTLGFFTPTSLAQPYDQMIVFGDSLSDTGRVREATDSFWLTNPRPDPPYYERGLFTNGPSLNNYNADGFVFGTTSYYRVWHERLADDLDVSWAFPVPQSGSPASWQTNYAVGGATTEPGHGGFVGSILDLPNITEQVGDFLADNRATTANTLYTVWGGGNDLLNALDDELDNFFSVDPDNIRQAARDAVNNTMWAIHSLALDPALGGAGAKHVIWPNLPPMDKVPAVNFLSFFDDNGWSAAEYASLQQAMGDASTQIFNDEMDIAIAALQSVHDGLTIHKLDVLGLTNEALDNPDEFGLTETVHPAILYDSFGDLTFSASPNWPNTLIDPDAFLFWDQIHPSAAMHDVIGQAAYGLLFPGPVLGDLNGDGAFTLDDIDPFVMALIDPDTYATTYPGLDPVTLGDFNESGTLTNADIYGFVAALTGGTLTEEQAALFEAAYADAVPEPSSLILLALACGLVSRRRMG